MRQVDPFIVKNKTSAEDEYLTFSDCRKSLRHPMFKVLGLIFLCYFLTFLITFRLPYFDVKLTNY